MEELRKASESAPDLQRSACFICGREIVRASSGQWIHSRSIRWPNVIHRAVPVEDKST